MSPDEALSFCYYIQSQWSTVFSGIVSRAVTLEVLSTGVAGNYNGALQVVHTELHVYCIIVLFTKILAYYTGESLVIYAFESIWL